MIITYTPDGLLAPDKRAYDIMKDLLDKGEDIAIGSDCLISALRLLILEEYIPADKVTIHFEDKVFQFDEDAQPEIWFDGFQDVESDVLYKMFRLRLEKRLNKKESVNK